MTIYKFVKKFPFFFQQKKGFFVVSGQTGRQKYEVLDSAERKSKRKTK
jgi:hypothetical protein